MEQLLLHLVGDYLTQSHAMAQNKTKNSLAAAVHAIVYSVPFLLLAPWRAVLVIGLTHFLIDRFRLARYVVFAKNCLAWPLPKWEECRETGYFKDVPAWLAIWLLIVADNTLHLLINYACIRWIAG